mgnify:CR=1 FL=1
MNKLTRIRNLKLGDRFYHSLIPYELSVDQVEINEHESLTAIETFCPCPVTGDHIIFTQNGNGSPVQCSYDLDDIVWKISE